jgi:thioesterase domain-containing protein
LAQIVERPALDVEHSNLVQIRPGNPGKRHPLFLIHPGEGEIGYARTLAARLDADLPVYALAAVGLLEGETPIHGVREMASAYIRAIRKVQQTGPYRLAGWSAGGTIAYEMGRQLLEAGCTVSFLGLIDTASDYQELRSIVPAASGNADFDDAAMLLLDAQRRYPDAPFLNQWQRWAREGQVFDMIDSARQAGVFPAELDTAVVRRHLAVRAAIMRSLTDYVRPPAALTVSLFLAMEERTDLSLGWDKATDVQREMMVVGGTHYSIVEEPYVTRLARAIATTMATAAAPTVVSSLDLEVQ